MEYRAQEAMPIDGKPSWYGQYRPTVTCSWRTVSSSYGRIRYTSPEYAIAAAKVVACRDI